MTSLYYEWNIGLATISNIVMDLCISIVSSLQGQWLKHQLL